MTGRKIIAALSFCATKGSALVVKTGIQARIQK